MPEAEGRTLVHDIIYQELVQGQLRPKSRAALADLIRALTAEHQLEGLILGCTELGLLIGPSDSPVPLFDTTRLHAQAAVDLALAEADSTETTAAA